MNKKQILDCIKGVRGDTGWIINHLVEELVDQNPDMSNEYIGREIRETVKAIRKIKSSLIKRQRTNKIRKLKDDIMVYENTIIGMKKQLQDLKDKK